ncbi:MAG: antitoxin Xre/MbcA/ParS toxin-binding domain-containing protein [Amphritea sp.]
MTQRAGLKVAKAILTKWSCSDCEIDQILADEQDLDLRISYILNIHARLRTLFENPDNVYGFMSYPNHNDFFAGRSPLELIINGNLSDLKAVCDHIQSIGEV